MDVRQFARVVMSMIRHRRSATGPAHETPHFAIDQRTQRQVMMIRHQWTRKQLDLVPLERFTKDSLECLEVLLVVKDRGPQVTTIQGMIRRMNSSNKGTVKAVSP